MTYEHLRSPKNTMPGVADSILIAPVSWFDTDGIQCADPESETATLDTATQVTTPHVFLTDKGFIEIICAPFKNTFGAKTTGDVGSLGMEQTLTAYVPGSDPKLHATIALLKNQPCIVLIKDSNCKSGMYYQIGCDCLFAYFTAAEFNSGDTRGSNPKGWQLTITGVSEAVTTYKAAVQLLPTP